jgi:hypothetical protein
MVGRRDQETNWLSSRIGNRFSFGPRYGLGIQGIEDNHSLAGRDNPAVQIAGTEHVMAGNDRAYAAGLAALRLLGVRRSATQEHDNQSYG